ncbi:MAG: L-lysine 6-transaminase, partial [Sphingobacteriia bacterium]
MNPAEVKKVLGSHILADGMNIVMDLERSHGSYVYDSLGQRELLDFFTCFATIPLGYNHPGLKEDKAFMDNLLLAALGNPSNSLSLIH